MDNDLSHSGDNRHPSPGVQAAFNRLRQVRRDLLELSDSLQARLAAEGNMLDPGHEAIMLTGSPSETTRGPEDQNSSNSTSNVRSDNRPQYTTRVVTHPVSLSSPLMAMRPPSRRTIMESQLRLARNMDPDDPNTFLGMRVAARVSALSDRPPSQPSSHPPPTILENTLFSQHSLSMDEILAGQTTSEERNENLERRRFELSSQALFAARSSISAQRSSETRMSGSEPSARQQTPSTHADRLSMLSNFSVQNFPTPRSSILARPLLFDEPTSYVEQDPVHYSSTLERLVEDEASTRSYVIHRRLNADGEEYVHNINLDWTEGMGADPNNSHDTQQQLPDPEVVDLRDYNTRRVDLRDHSRRRGWARLDADGNEISVDDEEELEHLRTTSRMQASQRARDGIHVAEDRRDGFNEWEELDDNYDAQPYYTEVLSHRTGTHRRVPSVLPFRPDPLPMPLAHMIDCEQPNSCSQRRDFVLFLPPSASMAGR